MLAEVRLLIGTREARLVLKKGDDTEEDELWTFERKMSRTEAEQFARCIFQDAYGMMQFVVHGD